MSSKYNREVYDDTKSPIRNTVSIVTYNENQLKKDQELVGTQNKGTTDKTFGRKSVETDVGEPASHSAFIDKVRDLNGCVYRGNDNIPTAAFVFEGVLTKV